MPACRSACRREAVLTTCGGRGALPGASPSMPGCEGLCEHARGCRWGRGGRRLPRA